MPKIASLGALSSRGFGEFLQQSSAKYIEDYFSTWLYTGTGANTSVPTGESLVATEAWSTIKYAQGSTTSYGVASDSSSNVYICGQTNDGQACFAVAKFDSTGALVWQRKVKENNFGRGYAVAVDSSGNVYATGLVVSSTPSVQNCVFTVKYNSSGVLQWQRKLTDTNAFGYAIAVDASGNVHVTGIAGADGTNNYCIVAKYDTSGTLQWSRNFRQSISEGRGIAVNSSGDVYVVASTLNNGYIALVKYNSSGTLQWQRRLEQTGTGFARGVALDSSGNPYIVGYSNDGSNYILTAKYNSSGTIQWQRKVTSSINAGGIAIDLSDSIYITGNVLNRSFIAKYNSSGVIQWQRSLFETVTEGTGVATDASGNVYLSSTANNNTYIGITKLKGDGTTTSGSAFLYMFVSTASETAGTATETASTGTSTSSAATAAAGTATDAAGTATASLASQVATTTSGGLVWIKSRSAAIEHALYDTARGATFDLVSNSTAAQTTQTTGLTSFSASGFSLGSLAKVNTNGAIYAAWTFVETPKFFDVVTYTGNGASSQTISHNLGSVPGMIIAKGSSAATNWPVYHRQLNNGVNPEQYYLILDGTAAQSNAVSNWGNIAPTATQFTVGANNNINGYTYVAYLFAHDAGGFGLTGSDNVVTCGSYTGNGSATGPSITLGYEPQFVLIKSATASGDWIMTDIMRGMGVATSANAQLRANTSAAEASLTAIAPDATGFSVNTTNVNYNTNGTTYVYMAIRRGPMKVPTDATTVFNPRIATTDYNGSTPLTGMNPGTDVWWNARRTPGSGFYDLDRLRGWRYLQQSNTNAENSTITWSQQTQTSLLPSASWWGGSASQVSYFFNRAPGFMDVVCVTAFQNGTLINHNLGAAPELIFAKNRTTGGGNWMGFANISGTAYGHSLNATTSFYNSGLTASTYITSITIDPIAITNAGGGAQKGSNSPTVLYLFATCPGVSKVGTYTGNGATQTISCGFTGGARYVMIKRTDSTGDWWVWDTARGMVAGTDPRLAYNLTTAENNANWVYTTTGGFQIVTSDATVNASGGTYIYLAIA